MNRIGSLVISLTLSLSAVMAGVSTVLAAAPTSPAVTKSESSIKSVTKTLFGVKLAISIPSDFEEVRKDQKLKSTEGYDVFWAPPFKKDESSRPTLAIAVFSVGALPPDARSTDLSDAFISSFPEQYPGFKKAPSKEVVINGRKYGMVTWDGHSKTNPNTLVRGVAYVGLLGTKAIAVDYRDPTKAQLFRPQVESSARTLKVL